MYQKPKSEVKNALAVLPPKTLQLQIKIKLIAYNKSVETFVFCVRYAYKSGKQKAKLTSKIACFLSDLSNLASSYWAPTENAVINKRTPVSLK